MSPVGSPKRHAFALTGAILLGLAISLILLFAIRKLGRQNAQIFFERLAQERFDRLEGNVALNLNDIVSLGSYLDDTKAIKRQEFARLTAPLLAQNRAIQALEWAPNVPNELRRSFEDDAHHDGLAAFQFTERLPDGRMVGAAERRDYVPVFFVEPLQGNEKALGFDLLSNATRRETIRRSTDSGELGATGRITLVQETADQYGVLIFRPVYRTGVLLSSEKERREALSGFVLGVIRVGDMVETVRVAGSAARSLGLIILDLNAAPSEQLLYPKNGSFGLPADFRSTRTISVAGRNWQVTVYPLPGAFTVAHWNSWTALVTALLLTGLWTGYLRHGLDRNSAIERTVTERTAALREALGSLRESDARYRKLVDLSPEAIVVERKNAIVAANKAALELFGVSSASNLIGLRLADFVSTGAQGGMDETVKRMYAGEMQLPLQEGQVRRADGVLLDIEVAASSFQESGGGVVQAVMRDITGRKVAEERIQSLAYYDALTGLPNRILLRDRLSKALATARRQKHRVALLFLDLDRFKIINDSLGHSVGDLLLQAVAERLQRCAREQDTVARLGGDEFLIVLTSVKDVTDAAVAAERLMDAMTAGFVVQGHSLSISCSLGISVFPEHGADGETLIKNADAAMYSAKDYGRKNFQFFTADMNAQVVERLTLENTLRTALDKKELFLVYQPQMNLATRRITGLEALLRWHHPELGLVPPDKFIRIAENCGLIVPIGGWVLRTACSQAQKWQDEGLLAVPVAVNVSAVQFRQEDFCKVIRGVLQETGLAPQYLELELTESLLLANADVTFSVLQELKTIGLTLAIDDFGTGYSSFNYLRQFRVSKLKIDRSFVREVAVNPDDAAITTAIIGMAKSLNLKVIAEGVENEAQMSFLRAHQCDEIQGYYFSKPLAADEVADKLRADDSETRVGANPLRNGRGR